MTVLTFTSKEAVVTLTRDFGKCIARINGKHFELPLNTRINWQYGYMVNPHGVVKTADEAHFLIKRLEGYSEPEEFQPEYSF